MLFERIFIFRRVWCIVGWTKYKVQGRYEDFQISSFMDGIALLQKSQISCTRIDQRRVEVSQKAHFQLLIPAPDPKLLSVFSRLISRCIAIATSKIRYFHQKTMPY